MLLLCVAAIIFYGQASYTDWLHFEKCPNVTNQGTIPTVVSPINVQCLSVYTDKHCTLIGDISKWNFFSNVTNQCTNLVPKGRTSIVHWLVTKAENFWENVHQSYQISNQSMYNACLNIPSSIVHWLVNKKCFQTGIQVLYIDWLYFGFINSCQNL